MILFTLNICLVLIIIYDSYCQISNLIVVSLSMTTFKNYDQRGGRGGGGGIIELKSACPGGIIEFVPGGGGGGGGGGVILSYFYLIRLLNNGIAQCRYVQSG